MDTFKQELTDLLNRHSKENESDTPDFMLAEYLIMCLNAYEVTLNDRRDWYAFEK